MEVASIGVNNKPSGEGDAARRAQDGAASAFAAFLQAGVIVPNASLAAHLLGNFPGPQRHPIEQDSDTPVRPDRPADRTASEAPERTRATPERSAAASQPTDNRDEAPDTGPARRPADAPRTETARAEAREPAPQAAPRAQTATAQSALDNAAAVQATRRAANAGTHPGTDPALRGMSIVVHDQARQLVSRPGQTLNTPNPNVTLPPTANAGESAETNTANPGQVVRQIAQAINAGNQPAAPQAQAGAETKPAPAQPAPPASPIAGLGAATGLLRTASAQPGEPGLGQTFAVGGAGGSVAERAAASATARAPLPNSPQLPRQVADQIAVQISRAVSNGADRITIRLHPAQLGQVDVKMEVTHDGRLHATVVVERPETLEQLQRDARLLERALQDAGLKADTGSLNFSLRSDGGASQHADQDAGDGMPSLHGEDDDADPTGATPTQAAASVDGSGVDIRV